MNIILLTDLFRIQITFLTIDLRFLVQYKAPKVQRLVTPIMLQRKRHRLALKRRRAEKNRQATAEYAKILAQRQKEAKEAKELRRKRSASHRESRASKSSISQ